MKTLLIAAITLCCALPGRAERGWPADAQALREQGGPGRALADEVPRRQGAGRCQREVPGRQLQLQQESSRYLLASWWRGELVVKDLHSHGENR